jgi:hypothetical protein
MTLDKFDPLAIGQGRVKMFYLNPKINSNLNLKTHLLMMVLALSCLIQCAEPVEDISLVQPHYLEKSIFVDEWYFRQTLVDLSPEIAVGFNGLEGSLEKIKWKITENTLYAYRSYEPVPKLNENPAVVEKDQWGVVAAFDIISHFDILRNYNPSTKEPGNLLVENVIDRPWYERKYMRVNWASNRIAGPVDLTVVWWLSKAIDYIRDTESQDIGQLIIEPDYIQVTTQGTISDNGRTCYFSYGVSHCGSAEARVLMSFRKIKADEAVGFKPLVYMDNEPLAKIKDSKRDEYLNLNPNVAVAEHILCPYPEHSSAYVTYCEPVKLVSFSLGKDRHNVSYACTPDFMDVFNRQIVNATGYVDHFSCYEERVSMFQRFGFFRTERFPYDRQLGGATDQTRVFYANHHQIFSDEAQSQIKPIIYYTNPVYPSSLEKITGQIANRWDRPFMDAMLSKLAKTEEEIRNDLLNLAKAEGVQAWRFFEGDQLRSTGLFQIRRNRCSAQGIQAYLQDIAASLSLDKKAELEEQINQVSAGFGIVEGDLLAICAQLRWYSKSKGMPTFQFEQPGDLRYNFVNWVNEPQPSGPLGYGPSSADPENGRIISANANVYGAALDTYARNAVDIIRAMNEDLSLNEIINGKQYEAWLQNQSSVTEMQLEQDQQALKDQQSKDQPSTKQPIHEDLFDEESAYGRYHDDQGNIDLSALERNLKNRMTQLNPNDPLYLAQASQENAGQNRLAQALSNPLIAQKTLDDQILSLLAPLYQLSPQALSQRGIDQEEVYQALIEDALHPMDRQERLNARLKYFSDQNIHLAEFYDDSIIGLAMKLKDQPIDELYTLIREKIYEGVLLHEIGHTLGMTHNFSASFDALNYHDDYWQIHSQTPTEDHALAQKPEYQYASIMDYGARFNSDFHGLGKYDHAAIRFVYGGQQIEIFEDDFDLVPDLSLSILINGYQTIPSLFNNDITKIKNRKIISLEAFKQQQLDGLFLNSQKLADNPDAALAAAGLKEIENPPQWEGFYWLDRSVPYKYCFDIYNGNLECKTFDEGASHEDVVRSAIRNDWSYFVFNHYRRGRDENAFINGFFGRQSRLGLFLTYPFRYYYFYQNYDLNLKEDLYKAAMIGLNFINQVIGTPADGQHCYLAQSNQYVPRSQLEVGGVCDQPIDIPLGTGRPFNLNLNGEYLPKIDYIGTYFDKVNILYQLSDTSSYFFQVANLADRRNFSIGFYRMYQKQLVNLVKDIVFNYLGDDHADSFEYVVQPTGKIEPKILVNEAGFNQGDTSALPTIQSSLSYNIIWQMLLLQSAFNTSSYDSREDFVEFIAIQEVGSGDDRVFADNTQTVDFISPYQSVVYRAAQSTQGNSIAFELLERANVLSEAWANAKMAYENEMENSSLKAEFLKLDRQMGRVHDLISDFRLLRSAFDFYND